MKKPICVAAAVLCLLALTACKEEPSETTEPVECLHENIDYVEQKAPTCTEDGLTRKVCLDCGAVLEENPSAAVGHVWTISFDDEGNAHEVCAICGYDPSADAPATEPEN